MDDYAAVTPRELSSATTTLAASSTRASSRKTRVYAFREFLLQSYGSYLQNAQLNNKDTTPIVLDVAGGKGDLSWLLQNIDGINSVVLDPRGDVSKCSIPKSVRYLMEHPDEAEQRAVPGLPTHQPLAGLIPKLVGKKELVTPWHLPVCLDQELVDRIKDVVDGRVNAIDEWKLFWDTRMNNNCVRKQDRAIDSKINTAISDADQALQAFLSITLVAGFHPDQATDYCIELAETLRIPFCIVPCCVFPSEFPNRRLLRTKEKVQNYTQLIQYLREKCPQAKIAYLYFHFAETAKNLVLYTVPAATTI
ncbi:hypothetical protein IV203_010313 [Nitzschia inconspicua]|uniref:Uncharacterized protein n=1 Tax=Nitzschia inconspicua TaxID=303405 RepID=A0A9K3PKS8_9STRA|nr:hypothetical protein IV203_010313 [Nitzschia inconspicua]